MIKVVVCAVVLLVASNSFAGVKVIGDGDGKRFDPAGFPPAMKSNYEILKAKCVKCHSMERLVEAVTTGISPISGQPFDRNAVKAYGMKMTRKNDANMSKREIAATVDLMNFLLDQAAR